jgi:hypothetical protein
VSRNIDSASAAKNIAAAKNGERKPRAPKQPPLTTPIYGNNDALSVAFRYARKEMPDYNDKHPKLRDIATAIGENMLWFRKDADIAKVVRKVIAA